MRRIGGVRILRVSGMTGMKHLRLAVILWAAALLPVQAAETGDAELATLRTTAQELRQKSQMMRVETEQRHAATERVCLEKFLAASCLEDAKKARQQSLREAKLTEQESRGIDRQIKARERETKAARRLEEAPQREAAAAERAEKSRREYEEAQQRVERKQAESAQRGQK